MVYGLQVLMDPAAQQCRIDSSFYLSLTSLCFLPSQLPSEVGSTLMGKTVDCNSFEENKRTFFPRCS